MAVDAECVKLQEVLPMVCRRRTQEFDRRLIIETIVDTNAPEEQPGHIRRDFLNRAA